MISTSLMCRGPTSHLANYLRKESEWGHLAELATGKADAIFTEFEIVLDDSRWGNLLSGMEDEAEAIRMNSFAAAQVLLHASGMHRRVVLPLLGFPFKIFWLAKTDILRSCTQRHRAECQITKHLVASRMSDQHCGSMFVDVRYNKTKCHIKIVIQILLTIALNTTFSRFQQFYPTGKESRKNSWTPMTHALMPALAK